MGVVLLLIVLRRLRHVDRVGHLHVGAVLQSTVSELSRPFLLYEYKQADTCQDEEGQDDGHGDRDDQGTGFLGLRRGSLLQDVAPGT